ncbi:hypothetical protein K491DRAFT_782139 [Lophiostoma macrostomum CBS 122681]|uniref:Uncharacterized protein n=1 Tax=Lophiostoma macrostomum CBS 122681 TaxID=1314788 RepID=A0A6A6STS8_9PLEO|nr:hypothetical protein K491DRAFT_782139 [Lophiostoma macrostomum CBS 122681]
MSTQLERAASSSSSLKRRYEAHVEQADVQSYFFPARYGLGVFEHLGNAAPSTFQLNCYIHPRKRQKTVHVEEQSMSGNLFDIPKSLSEQTQKRPVDAADLVGQGIGDDSNRNLESSIEINHNDDLIDKDFIPREVPTVRDTGAFTTRLSQGSCETHALDIDQVKRQGVQNNTLWSSETSGQQAATARSDQFSDYHSVSSDRDSPGKVLHNPVDSEMSDRPNITIGHGEYGHGVPAEGSALERRFSAAHSINQEEGSSISRDDSCSTDPNKKASHSSTSKSDQPSNFSSESDFRSWHADDLEDRKTVFTTREAKLISTATNSVSKPYVALLISQQLLETMCKAVAAQEHYDRIKCRREEQMEERFNGPDIFFQKKRDALTSLERKMLKRPKGPSVQQIEKLKRLREEFVTIEENHRPYLRKQAQQKEERETAKRSAWEWAKELGRELAGLCHHAGLQDQKSRGATSANGNSEFVAPSPPRAASFYSSNVPAESIFTSQSRCRQPTNLTLEILQTNGLQCTPEVLENSISESAAILEQRRAALAEAREAFDRHKWEYKSQLVEHISSQKSPRSDNLELLDEFGPIYLKRGQDLTRRLREAEEAYEAALASELDRNAFAGYDVEQEGEVQVTEEVALILEELKNSKVDKWLQGISDEIKGADIAAVPQPVSERKFAPCKGMTSTKGWTGLANNVPHLQCATGDVEPLPQIRKRRAVDDISPVPLKRQNTEGKEFEAHFEPIPEEVLQDVPPKEDNKAHVDDERWDSISLADVADVREAIVSYAKRQRRGFL